MLPGCRALACRKTGKAKASGNTTAKGFLMYVRDLDPASIESMHMIGFEGASMHAVPRESFAQFLRINSDVQLNDSSTRLLRSIPCEQLHSLTIILKQANPRQDPVVLSDMSASSTVGVFN